MGGPGSGRKPSSHTVEISKVNGKIKKIGASHHTKRAASRAKLHNRSTHNIGMKNPGGLKVHNKSIAFRVNI